MSENLYCIGQRKPNFNWTEGYMRTFMTPPELGKEVREMLDEYIEGEEYAKAIIFFRKYCKLDEDYSVFLVREMINGNY